jgi:hypothetical protein
MPDSRSIWFQSACALSRRSLSGGGADLFLRILDACVLFGFDPQGVPFMSKIICRLAPALLILIFSGFAFGDDFKSLTIDPLMSSETIRVHNGQFMVVRNFTQENGATRGVVMVTKPPSGSTPVNAVNVLTAALLTDPPDVINSVVIAGPADVVFTCGDTTGHCFVSYKKDSN